MSLQVEQTPILDEIGRALIAATPEHWKSAVLELVATAPVPGVVGLTHAISSPEGYRDVVVPTEELMEASTHLQALCERYGKAFARLVFEINYDEQGGWRFTSDWSY